MCCMCIMEILVISPVMSPVLFTGSLDIYNGELKLILGLIWTLNQYYIDSHVRTSNVSTKQTFLTWINWKIPSMKIVNLNVNWNSGIALCALIDSFKPGACPQYAALSSENKVENCRLGIDLAEKYFDIPSIISPEDLSNPRVDDCSVMTYLSYFLIYFKTMLLQWIRQRVTFKVIDNLNSDWCDGLCLTALCNTIKPGMLPDVEELDPEEGLKNITNAMIAADSELNISITYVQPADMANAVESDDILKYIYLGGFMTARPKIKATATGEALEKVVVGHRTQFKLEIGYGSIEDIKIEIQNGSDMLESSIEEVTSNEYIISYIPVLLGPTTVTLKGHDQPIADSPYHVEVLKVEIEESAAKRPMKITLTGVNEITLMTVFIQDPDKNTKGVRLSSISEEKLQGIFVPPIHGEYTIIIKIDGIEIPGSPFKVEIKKLIDYITFSAIVKSPIKAITGVVTRLEVSSDKAYLMEEGFLSIRYDTKSLACSKIECGTFDSSLEEMQYTFMDEGFGCYVTEFLFPKPGDYGMSVLLDGDDIAGSPFGIKVMEPVDASKCFILQKLRSSPVNVGTRIEVQFDCTTAGDGKLAINVNGPETPLHVQASLESSSSRRVYSLMFIPEEVGDHTLNILWGGVAIPSTPITFTAVDPKQVKILNLPSNGEFDLVTGETVVLYINISLAGPAPLFVYGISENRVKQELPLKDESNGIFLLKYLTTQVGSMHLLVVFNEVEVKAIPVTISLAPDATKCIVDLSFLKDYIFNVGEALEFTVDCTSAGSGNLDIRAQTSDCKVIIGSKESFVSNNKRIFHCFLKVESAGAHELIIQWAGVSIPGGPFTFEVCDPNALVFLGLKEMYTPIVGETISFDVDVSKAGKAMLLGRAVLYSGRKVDIQVVSKEDGINTLIYEALHTGLLEFVIYFNSIQVRTISVLTRAAPDHEIQVLNHKQRTAVETPRGSPVCQPVVDPSKCVIIKMPADLWFVGVEEVVKVSVEGAGSENLEAIASDPSVIKTRVEQPSENIISVILVPTAIGKCSITLKWAGVKISNMPIQVNVCDPSQITLHGVELETKRGKINKDIKLTVKTASAGKADLAVKVTGFGDTKIPFKVSDNDNNSYSLTFVPTKLGKLSIEVTWGGVAIPNSPFCIKITTGLDSGDFYVIGKGIEQAVCGEIMECEIVGTEAHLLEKGILKIKLEGENLKYRLVKADEFTMSKEKDIQVSITDDGKYHYPIQYMIPNPGTYILTILLEDTNITNSPFNIHCIPPPNPSECRKALGTTACFDVEYPVECSADIEVSAGDSSAHGKDPQPGLVYSSSGEEKKVKGDSTHINSANFKVNPPKQIGKRIPPPNPSECRKALGTTACFDVEYPVECSADIEVSAGDSSAHVKDPQPGIVYSSSGEEKKVKSDSTHINSANFKVNPPKQIGKQNNYVTFCITGIKEDAKQFDIVAIHTEHKAVVTQKKSDSGTICHFIAKQLGEYNIMVKFGGKHISGSPFTVDVCNPDNCQLSKEFPKVFHIGEKKIETVDIDANKVGPGSLTFSLRSLTDHDAKQTLQYEMTETGSKSYNIMFKPLKVGSCQVAIMWSGYDIHEGVFEVNVVDSQAVVVNSNQEKIIVDEEVIFNIDGRSAGKALPAFKVKGPKAEYTTTLKNNQNGTFTGFFTPWHTGEHSVEVLWGGRPVNCSPFKLTVRRAVLVDPTKIIIEGYNHGCAGIPGNLLISSSHRDLLEEGGLSANMSKQAGANLEGQEPKVKLIDNHSTTYKLTYLVPIAGEYKLTVTYDNVNISNSPLSLSIRPPADCDKCRVQHSYLDEDHNIKNPVDFSVDVTDAGPGLLTTKVMDPNDSQVKVCSNVDHTPLNVIHYLTFNPKITGNYIVNIFWDDMRIPGTPFNVNVIDPSKCTIKGLPLKDYTAVLNKDFIYSVNTKNAGNGKVHSVISRLGQDNTILTAIKKGNHEYQFQYLPDKIGKFSILIYFSKKELNGSPFPCKTVDIIRSVGARVVLSVEAVLVCEPYEFHIQGSFPDPKGIKAIAHGPKDDIAVEVYPPVKSLYVARFIPLVAGCYKVFVEYPGQQISNSSFSVACIDPGKCKIIGNLPLILQVGKETEFVVKTIDSGPGTISLLVNNEQDNHNCKTVIETQSGNMHKIILTPRIIGGISVHVLFAGYGIPRTPFRAQICDASKCKIIADFIQTGQGLADKTITFTLVTIEAGIAKPTVKAQGPTSQYSVDVIEVAANTYKCGFTPWEVGKHLIHVIWGVDHIPGSPFQVAIGQSDKGVCIAAGPELKEVVAGEPTKFNIYTKEPGLVDNGILVVDVTAIHYKVDVQIEDKCDGEYMVTYTTPEPGAYLVKITYNGKDIAGSPFKVDAISRPDASKCHVYGPALESKDNRYTDVAQEFYVDTANAGRGKLNVLVRGPNDEQCTAHVKEEDGKIYSIKFNAEHEGLYIVKVFWSNNPVPGNPFRIKVQQAVNAKMVNAYGSGLQNGRVGECGEFTIETKNAGSGTPTVYVHGVTGSFKVEVFAKDPDKPHFLTARYNPTIAGKFDVFIRWGGTQIPGSPFTVLIADPSGLIPSATVSSFQYQASVEKQSQTEKKLRIESSKIEMGYGDDYELPTELAFSDEDEDDFQDQMTIQQVISPGLLLVT